MGNMLFLRLLASRLYELTTAKIRLQLIHVVCLRQTSQEQAVLPFVLNNCYLLSFWSCPLPLLLRLEISPTEIFLFILKCNTFVFSRL